MEQTSTYNVKSRQDGFVWQFKYHLNGALYSFKVLDSQLSPKQAHWLFATGKFPVTEDIMKKEWMKKLNANFVIEVGEPDLSFDAFWNAYAHKIGKKKMAENSWNKLSKADKIKALMAIKDYNRYLSRKPGIEKAHATTYLNQEYYNNEYKSAV